MASCLRERGDAGRELPEVREHNLICTSGAGGGAGGGAGAAATVVDGALDGEVVLAATERDPTFGLGRR